MGGFKMRTHWLIVLALAFMTAGCTSCGSGNAGVPPPPPPPPPVDRPGFDRARAFDDLIAQVDFGPRIPGSQAHQACLDWLLARLQPLADQVVRQDFSASTPMGSPYAFTNVVAIFGQGQPGDALMIGAHWDCRPRADQDPDPANRNLPVPGANDGASGVGVLLEIARALKAQTPPHPVMLAFFDAEDSGTAGSQLPYYGFCIGSRYLAAHWPQELPQPARVVVCDLVGADNVHNDRIGTPNGSTDKFELPYELNSIQHAGEFVHLIWNTAHARGNQAFAERQGPSIVDDHMPFIDAGQQAVDIINFPPPEWHTIDDTPAHCSADSLYQVGDTLLEVLYGS